MGDAVALVMLAIFTGGWWKLAEQLKPRGMHRLIRHMLAATLALLASLGAVIASAGLGLISGNDGPAFDLFSLVLGFIFMTPLVMSIAQTRDSRREEKESAVQREIEALRKLGGKPSTPTFSRSASTLESSDENSWEDESLTISEPLHFEYEDAHGNVTSRLVTDWDYDGEYIRGMCLMVGEERTFRRDRIIHFFSGRELLDA